MGSTGTAHLSKRFVILLALLSGLMLPDTVMAQKSQGPVSQDLLNLLEEYQAFRAANPEAAFTSTNPLLRIRDDQVLADATATGEAEALLAELEALGLQNGSAFGRVVSGWLPIVAIAALENLQHLKSIHASSPSTVVVGTTTALHVAATGDDANDGSAGAPWATLQRAAEQVQPGDTVFVHDGTYAGFQIEEGGVAGQPIVFLALGNDVVVNAVNPVFGRDNINVEGADYVVIDGFRVQDAERAGIRVVTARGVVVKNNIVGPNGKWGIFTGFAREVEVLDNVTFGSADEHGIYVSNSDVAADNPIIRGNVSYDNNGSGIQLNGDCLLDGSDGVIEGAVIENNIVWDNYAKGLSLISIADAVVQNNLIYDNGRTAGAGGIHLTDEPGCGLPTTNTVVVNNTIVESQITGIRTSDEAASNIIFNNLVVSDKPIVDEDGGNLIDAASNLTLSSTAALFVDAPGGDYHLADGSAAIDAGVASYQGIDAPALDLDGVTRSPGSARDVGAYEGPGTTPTGVESSVEAPDGYVLSAVYPNPFNPQTQFTLAVGERQQVSVTVYDALGRRMASLYDGALAANQEHLFTFDAADLPSGLYVIRIAGETFAAARRVMLVK